MTVETVSFLTTLDSSLPRKSDLLKEGDDHIRNIKAALKLTLPNFDKALTISADTLNYLDQSFKFDGDGVSLNKPLNVTGTSSGWNMGGNQIKNVASPVDEGDVVTLGSLSTGALAAMYPVGSYYISSSPTNPATIFGFGVWDQDCQGNIMVGAGTFTDTRNETRTFRVGQPGGTYSHVINIGEMPLHSHGAGSLSGTTGPAGGHQHSTEAVAIPGGGGWSNHVGQGSNEIHYVNLNTNWAPDHTHSVSISGNTASTGSGQPMNLMQPYIVAYIFHRVS